MRPLICLFVLVLAIGCGERPEFQFATGEAALASEVAEQGWVPGWMPADAKDVRLVYDVDTNEIWIGCEVEGAERTELVRGLAQVPWAQAGVVAFRSPGRAWWPHDELSAERGAQEVDIFSGDGRTILLERAGRRVFIYRWPG